MKKSAFRWVAACAVGIVVLSISVGVTRAFQVRPKTSRFDALVIENPTNAMNVSTTPVASLKSTDQARTKWDGFKSAHGPSWSVYLDRRVFTIGKRKVSVVNDNRGKLINSVTIA